MIYEVTTVEDAYWVYTVEADSPEAAAAVIKERQRAGTLGEVPGRDGGSGENWDVCDMKEVAA